MTTPSEVYEKRGRAIKLAGTYLRKSESCLYMDLPLDPAYWTLLEQVLNVAEAILGKLPDDFFETTQMDSSFFGLPTASLNQSDEPHEQIERLAKLIEERRAPGKRKRKIELLRNVEGRTPEEKVAYLAKADALEETS